MIYDCIGVFPQLAGLLSRIIVLLFLSSTPYRSRIAFWDVFFSFHWVRGIVGMGGVWPKLGMWKLGWIWIWIFAFGVPLYGADVFGVLLTVS